jgi:hypothetical protein
MQNQALFKALTLAGALPFVACALLPLLGINSISPLGRLDMVAAGYGFGILSFVAGTHWAFQLLRPSDTPFNLFLTSNVVFVIVWAGWVIAPLNWALVIQSLAFSFLLYVDRRLAARGTTSSGYVRIRSIATGAAIVSLLLIAVT